MFELSIYSLFPIVCVVVISVVALIAAELLGLLGRWRPRWLLAFTLWWFLFVACPFAGVLGFERMLILLAIERGSLWLHLMAQQSPQRRRVAGPASFEQMFELKEMNNEATITSLGSDLVIDGLRD